MNIEVYVKYLKGDNYDFCEGYNCWKKFGDVLSFPSDYGK